MRKKLDTIFTEGNGLLFFYISYNIIKAETSA